MYMTVTCQHILNETGFPLCLQFSFEAQFEAHVCRNWHHTAFRDPEAGEQHIAQGVQVC